MSWCFDLARCPSRQLFQRRDPHMRDQCLEVLPPGKQTIGKLSRWEHFNGIRIIRVTQAPWNDGIKWKVPIPWQQHRQKRWLRPWQSFSLPRLSCQAFSCKPARSLTSPSHQIQTPIPKPIISCCILRNMFSVPFPRQDIAHEGSPSQACI